MNLKKIIPSLFLCLMVTLLVACSYREFEDSIRNQLNNEDEEMYQNEAKIPEQPVEDQGAENAEDVLYFIGDTISFINDLGTVDYTLNAVQISENSNEVDLKKTDFDLLGYHYIGEDGSIDEHYKLVTVDVTIKNIDYTDYALKTDFEYSTEADSDRDIPLLFIEYLIGFKEGIEDPNGPFTIEASYFGGHTPIEDDPKGYYQFLLAHGEEVEVTVGWLVPADQLNVEPLYYIIGYSGHIENQLYFQLTENGEVIMGD
ncbi:DUF5027 family lipoprotein [Amphibacillus indicireducens]|uniref:DUF4352 domain-containing protein n=1 Tax=Amphibacillus indicireducens TaxID=1076330 RepID=A0ABP7V6Q6_9BACI